ncbi:hypothetical protein KAR91_53015 [Candidatus Pacearchaeota archaeon]|nr:hypothetical protein [Candidatus Pacearchaeota archaeon]
MKHQLYTPQIGDLKVAQDKGHMWRIYAYRENFYRDGYIWSELGFKMAYTDEIAALNTLSAHLEREEETGIKVR